MNNDQAQKLLSAKFPAAAVQAAHIGTGLLIDELTNKLAANMVLAEELQAARQNAHKAGTSLMDAARKLVDEQERAKNALAQLAVVHDFLGEKFCTPGEDLPSLETLLDRAAGATLERREMLAFVNGVKHVLDEGHMPRTDGWPEELRDTLAYVDRLVRKADANADAGPVEADWGVIQRLRAVLGHLRGGRYPSAISLLDPVIDELTSQVEPQVVSPDQEDELPVATAADRKIKENKEDPQPAF